MYIPGDSSTQASLNPSHRAPRELADNPITYEIIFMVAVVAFALMMLSILDCCRAACTDADAYYYEDCHGQQDDGGDEHEGDEAQPWDVTLTEDGALVDNESRGRRYGTFYVENGHWFNADGAAMSCDLWIETVYDPLD